MLSNLLQLWAMPVSRGAMYQAAPPLALSNFGFFRVLLLGRFLGSPHALPLTSLAH
jgi:hypothetical protein